MAWISFAAVVDVVWLHAAAYGVDVATFGRVEQTLWGLAVPWFFVSSMFWMAIKWRGFKVEMGRRVRSLLVPYFIWCLLGSAWSIALHGVQLHGWETLRYVGLHPWLDPAYQPMWFIRNLFLVLLIEAGMLVVGGQWLVVSGGGEKVVSGQWFVFGVRQLVFPVYLIHSIWLSVFRLAGVESVLLKVVASVGLSIVVAAGMRRYAPRVARILFGGR